MAVFSNSKNNSRLHKVTEQGEGGMTKYSHVALERYPRLKVCVCDKAERSQLQIVARKGAHPLFDLLSPHWHFSDYPQS